ncbi:hypothetical protein HYZ97_05185, partial [Candidatus Pacearchaeota archaeon]|nr:hypothetical protein [Candidatus Pacearchaeota archaeon]
KTQTSPFLHDGDYPIDFDRAYLFNLFGSEYLEVRAKQGETIEKCVLTLSFLPDPREAEKYEIARVYLAENRWCWKSDFLPGFSG